MVPEITDKECMTDAQEVYELCKEFIEEQRIWSAECVYQSDRVIENAYELIANICEIIGYVDLPDEEEEDE